jgi:hypothetical protein
MVSLPTPSISSSITSSLITSAERLFFARGVRGFFFGVSPLDPVAFLGVVSFLGVAVLTLEGLLLDTPPAGEPPSSASLRLMELYRTRHDSADFDPTSVAVSSQSGYDMSVICKAPELWGARGDSRSHYPSR